MSYKSSQSDIVAGNLRAEMARQRLTSNDLASFLSISQSSASRRINGDTAIPTKEIAPICEFLGIDVTRLLGEVAA